MTLAASEFDVFVTVDNNLPSQQNLQHLELAIVVLAAPTNRIADIKPLVPNLLEQLPKVLVGTATVIVNT